MRKKLKICLACSAGGHLTEILQLKELYKQYDRFFVTFKRIDSRELSKNEVVYFIDDPKRNPIKLIKNTFQTVIILLKERPKIIITTGAGVVIPLCYFGKIIGSKIVFIESFCRVRDKSFTGKMIYPVADLFLVQWRDLLDKYGKKAIYSGSLL